MTTPKRSTNAIKQLSNTEAEPPWPNLFKTPKRSRVQCPIPSVLNTIRSDECRDYVQKTKEILMSEKCVEEVRHSSSKIKLQLFPMDEGTRAGLERDGYHPYLELILHARKKIISVLKRLSDKWGGSSVAKGEPVLFPYNKSEALMSCRWTLNDTGINAGDVYAAIGNPSVFRLRYGWLSDSVIKSFEEPAESVTSRTCLLTEAEHKGNNAITDDIRGILTETDAATENLKQIFGDGATDIMSDKNSSNGLVKPMVNDVRADVGVTQPLALWDDSLTNISIGGLLSEASLQGRFNNCDPKPSGINTSMQPSQLVTDSFDAFTAAQVNTAQILRPTAHGSVSSILDAEDTCHAFFFPKFSCLDKNAAALNESISKGRDQGAVSKLFNYPQSAEVNVQSSSIQGHNFQDSDTDISLCSRVYNDENSLGLSGINWSDSLTPFDLGLSSSRMIISSDSLSLSKILSKQTN